MLIYLPMFQKLNIDLDGLNINSHKNYDAFPMRVPQNILETYKKEIVPISHFAFNYDELKDKKKSSDKIYTVTRHTDSRMDPADLKIIGHFKLLETAIKFLNMEIMAAYREGDVIEKCNDSDDEVAAYQIVDGESYDIFMITEKDIIIN